MVFGREKYLIGLISAALDEEGHHVVGEALSPYAQFMKRLTLLINT